ncbi:hypothetical protein B0H67DRAFT_116993 [Lasiosphaeris hirsuta]|uniref:Uncharacterized protein n=1 Tax=Lasiosphaeris hirsuta TaxID=260670 RepID=A0AA40AZF4_9PEZI|nr:hypothetical protein B0H67DRAFT_116993 [Lasiosphaeris hirsuta]
MFFFYFLTLLSPTRFLHCAEKIRLRMTAANQDFPFAPHESSQDTKIYHHHSQHNNLNTKPLLQKLIMVFTNPIMVCCHPTEDTTPSGSSGMAHQEHPAKKREPTVKRERHGSEDHDFAQPTVKGGIKREVKRVKLKIKQENTNDKAGYMSDEYMHRTLEIGYDEEDEDEGMDEFLME